MIVSKGEVDHEGHEKGVELRAFMRLVGGRPGRIVYLRVLRGSLLPFRPSYAKKSADFADRAAGFMIWFEHNLSRRRGFLARPADRENSKIERRETLYLTPL